MTAHMLSKPRITPGAFDILADEGALLDQNYPPIFGPAPGREKILGELPIDQQTLALRYPEPSSEIEDVDSKPKLLGRGQHRRLPIGDHIFQPLVKSEEDPSVLVDTTQPSQALEISEKSAPAASTDDSLGSCSLL